MVKYEYEINFDINELKSEIEDCCYIDEWGMAFMWLDDNRGIELNVCYDMTTDEIVCCNAFYPFENECLDLNARIEYEHYDIDFSDDEWKDRLAEAMEEYIDELVEIGYWE